MGEQKFKQAKALVQFAEKQFDDLSELYKKSLNQKEIDSELLILIKNIFENLRSALDYGALGLFQKYGISPQKKKIKIYFPYASKNQSLDDFRKNKSIESRIPGLSKTRPDIIAKIESYQHFSDRSNHWLPLFMELTNLNKHQELTPQIRTETKQLRISSGGVEMVMGEGVRIEMGKDTVIKMGNMIISGGQDIDVNNLPITFGQGKKEVIIWVSFNFAHNGESVIPFIRACLDGVKKIVDELSKA